MTDPQNLISCNSTASTSRVEVEVFECRNWTFRCHKGPMWGDEQFEALAPEESILKGASVVDRVPDAFFGNNLLEMRYNGSLPETTAETPSFEGLSFLVLRIEPRGAASGMRLEGWEGDSYPGSCFSETLGFRPSVFSVPGAERWRTKIESQSFGGQSELEIIEPSFDWTCSSKYWGTVKYIMTQRGQGDTSESFGHPPLPESFDTTIYFPSKSAHQCSSEPPKAAAPTCTNNVDPVGEEAESSDCSSAEAPSQASRSSLPEPLPVKELMDTTQPILWFQHCYMFVDDLSDSGTNCTEAKIRVMPDFWFAVYQQQIRVDGVGLRQVSVKLFHRFGESVVVRLLLWSEATDAVLRQRAQESCNSSTIGPNGTTEESCSSAQPQSMSPSFEFLRPEDVVFSVLQRIPITFTQAAGEITEHDSGGAKEPCLLTEQASIAS